MNSSTGISRSAGRGERVIMAARCSSAERAVRDKSAAALAKSSLRRVIAIGTCDSPTCRESFPGRIVVTANMARRFQSAADRHRSPAGTPRSGRRDCTQPRRTESLAVH